MRPPPADIAIICFSVTSRQSFESVSVFVDQQRRVKDTEEGDFILVATKIDQRPTPACQVSKEEGEALAKTLKAHAYLECSSMTFQGVDNVFDEALRVYIEKILPAKGGKPAESSQKCILC